MGDRLAARSRGFTLIELLIVIAVMSILMAIIIPAFRGSMQKANEAAAVSALNAIRVEEAKYASDHKGEFGTFEQLYAEGQLDKRFKTARPNFSGYVFRIRVSTKISGKPATYSVNADPEQATGLAATGKKFFYLDPNSPVCVNMKGPATAEDDAL
jgi:prepilin-type N-terminal cleavage/methylation domain-containing protein